MYTSKEADPAGYGERSSFHTKSFPYWNSLNVIFKAPKGLKLKVSTISNPPSHRVEEKSSNKRFILPRLSGSIQGQGGIAFTYPWSTPV
jgi:hypothetical protein